AVLHMDLVNVGAAAAAQVVKIGIVNPLGIEGDIGIGDRARAAGDQDFLATVGVQEHQVRRGAQILRLGGVGPDWRQAFPAVAPLHGTRRADVNDVVIV